MKRTRFNICNQAGIQASIENDGIWIRKGKNVQKQYFLKNLDDSWFKNPKAYLSISGSFMYLIINGELNLITLTSDKNKVVYADVLEQNTKFNDANFSCEETILYALTDSNRIIVFTLLPPRKIQEFSLDWDYIATSFKLIILPPSEDADLRNAFLFQSKNQSQAVNQFFFLDEQSSILVPIPEEESPFKDFDIQFHQEEDIIEEEEEPDDVLSPTTIEEAATLLLDRGKKLKEYEENIKERSKELNAKIDFINQKYPILNEKCKQSRKRFENLFARIQRLIETADGGIALVQKSKEQQSSQEFIKTFDNTIPYAELEDKIIFEYRSLQKLLEILKYNINLLQEALSQE